MSYSGIIIFESIWVLFLNQNKWRGELRLLKDATSTLHVATFMLQIARLFYL